MTAKLVAPIRLYHGTAHAFTAFGPPGAGSEPNSALGIHLTEDPAVAAEYAETAARDSGASHPRVLVVEAAISRVALTSFDHRYLGTNPETGEQSATWADFAALRIDLSARGFDAAATDCEREDLVGCHAIFDPSVLTIIGELTPDEAMAMDAIPSVGPLYESTEDTFARILGEQGA